MRSVLIVVFAPSLQLFAGVGKAHEPMGVQAFRAQLTIERLDEAVIRGLTWPREVQGNRIGISPEIKVARNELAAVVDPYRLGIADLTADAFERLDNILAAIGEPCIGRGAEAGMGVDNRENTELVAQCQLVMNKIHRPNIIGTDGFLAILAQLCLHTPLWALVPKLKP